MKNGAYAVLIQVVVGGLITWSITTVITIFLKKRKIL